MSLIALDKVSKSYPGPPRVDALIEVDLQMAAGDSVAVLDFATRRETVMKPAYLGRVWWTSVKQMVLRRRLPGPDGISPFTAVQ